MRGGPRGVGRTELDGCACSAPALPEFGCHLCSRTTMFTLVACPTISRVLGAPTQNFPREAAMTICFPHANRHAISDEQFIAAWIVWFTSHASTSDWQVASMPRLNAVERLDSQLSKGRVFSVDVLCRMLVPWSYRDTMHATWEFMRANSHLLEACDGQSPSNRKVNGARLTAQAKSVWAQCAEGERQALIATATSASKEALERANRTGRPAVPAHLHNETPPPVLEPDAGRASAPQVLARVVAEDGGPRSVRQQLIRDFVTWVDTEPYQPMYRKRKMGTPVSGWGARLSAYFWPRPESDYAKTAETMKPMLAKIGALARALDAGHAWSEGQRQDAVEVAKRIHCWGGVPQKPFSSDTVEAVIRAALTLQPSGPMNSGWSKVAAFATDWLEDQPARHPQVIWDSRVATAIVRRFDAQLAVQHLLPKAVFPQIGTVAGRVDTRHRGLRLAWRNGYQSWRSQFAGSELVAEIRDELNRRRLPMPLPDGGVGPWTMRGTEQVLFMDGY